MNILPIMDDEQKSQAYQLNLISQINMLNTHNYELQQKVQMLEAEIHCLRKALTAILNDAGYRNPMRMTTEISDKVLFEAKAALDEKA